MKRRKTILVQNNKDLNSDDDKPQKPNVFLTEENEEELVYSDLLDTLIIFITNIKNLEGDWREHR